MGVVSKFDGVTVEVEWIPNERPHFIVLHGDDNRIRLDIEKLASLWDGQFPRDKLGVVIEWAKRHRSELLDAWDRSSRGEPLSQIEFP